MNDFSYLKTVIDMHPLREILQSLFRARYDSRWDSTVHIVGQAACALKNPPDLRGEGET